MGTRQTNEESKEKEGYTGRKHCAVKKKNKKIIPVCFNIKLNNESRVYFTSSLDTYFAHTG